MRFCLCICKLSQREENDRQGVRERKKERGAVRERESEGERETEKYMNLRVRKILSTERKNEAGVQRSRHRLSSSYYQFLPKSGQDVYETQVLQSTPGSL